MKKVGSIYIIKNIKNNKVYIGQTTILNPMTRWVQHYRESMNQNNDLYLYKAIRKSGIENFSFRILETNIPIELLDSKEKEYIEKYQSNNKRRGYNLTPGGQDRITYKLTEPEVRDIIEAIKNGESFENLSIKYDVDRSTISDINCGETWFFADITYPIRKSKNTKRNFNKKEIADIFDMLKSNIAFSEIARKHNTSITTISRINRGELYYEKDIEYPISIQKCYSHLSIDKIKDIVCYLINTDMIHKEIANCLDVTRSSVKNINTGAYHKEELKSLGYDKFPIRDNYKP